MRPSYRATKSDLYTIIKSLPSQNGPGYSIPQANQIAYEICGLRNGAWKLPLPPPILDLDDDDEEEEVYDKYEAALRLIQNHESITKFATRGAAIEQFGTPSFQAELADPYCEPNLEYVDDVDVCLRHVTSALLHGYDNKDVVDAAITDLAGRAGDGTLRDNWYQYPIETGDGGDDDDDDDKDDSIMYYWWNDETGDVTYTPPTKQLDTCIMYLRDRIGVPRDGISEAAAMQLRGHLNWCIDILNMDPQPLC